MRNGQVSWKLTSAPYAFKVSCDLRKMQGKITNFIFRFNTTSRFEHQPHLHNLHLLCGPVLTSDSCIYLILWNKGNGFLVISIIQCYGISSKMHRPWAIITVCLYDVILKVFFMSIVPKHLAVLQCTEQGRVGSQKSCGTLYCFSMENLARTGYLFLSSLCLDLALSVSFSFFSMSSSTSLWLSL